MSSPRLICQIHLSPTGLSELTLPPAIMAILSPFAPVFSRPVWQHVELLVGAIFAPDARMVTCVPRVLGFNHLSSFQTYHHVLNRAVWSSVALSRILLGLLVVTTFASSGPLVPSYATSSGQNLAKGL